MENKSIIFKNNYNLHTLIYKNFFFIKQNYLFLSLYNINIICFFSSLNKKIINLKNNNKKLVNLYLFFKNKFTSYKFLFKNKFKFNYFLNLINLKFLKKKNKKLIKKNFFLLNTFKNSNYFFKNWFYLIGGMISPFYWDLQNQKGTQKKIPLLISKKKSITLFSRKIYLYNFFYFKLNNLNLSNLNHSLRVNFNLYKNKIDFSIKFNLYFNSSFYLKKKFFYSKFFIILLYKNYIKIFTNFKKNNFKFKMWNNFWFQKFSLKKTKFSFKKNFFRKFPKLYPIKKIYFNYKIFNTFIKKPNLTYFEKFFSVIAPQRYFFFFKLIIFKTLNNNVKSQKMIQFMFFDKNIKIKTTKFFFYANKYKISKKNQINIFLYNTKYIKKFKNFSTSNTFLNFRTFYFNYIFFITKSLTNLILSNHGFLYLNTFIYKKHLIYNFKKNLFSFIQKNEIEKMIIKRYQKINLIFNINYTNNQSFPKAAIFNPKNLLINKLHNNKSNFESWTFLNKKYEIYQDFSLKRIKFKPGYMNMWRGSRAVFKRIFDISFRYQHRLTNFLLKFNKFNKFKTFLINEMSLENILIKSRLFLDLKTSLTFINNGLVFVNGFLCYNRSFQTFVGDFIQLIVNFKYYILFRWFINWSIKNRIKLKKKIISKNTNQNSSEEKQKSFSFSKWILQHKNFMSDVSKYLEVDYFTLSIFIIYEPFLWTDLNIYSQYSHRYNIINLYNWKYIT